MPMADRFHHTDARWIFIAILGLALFGADGSPVQAQTFAPIPTLSFTKPFGGADPLPQILSVASTGAKFQFTAAASTATGGNWLSVSPTCANTCFTPEAISVTVNATTALAVGTYNGQIVFTKYGGGAALTVPVALIVASKNGPFFDNLPGQLSFSLQTGGASAPPGQVIEVRNGGSGALNWTLSTSTSDGGNWLSVSAASGTAPSLITAAISVQNLPGGGLTPGTFIGQLLFQTASDSVTIPIGVVVGDSVFAQVNPINFTKPFNGIDPLPQTMIIASTGNKFQFYASAATATGGNWLSVSPTCPNTCFTSEAITAIVTTSPTLAAGTYTGEIVLTSYGSPNFAMTVPVTLTVAPTASAFFDNVPGQMSFSMQPGGTPPVQTVQIRNGGSGTLNWTLATSTADGGNWLSVSAASGTAPSLVNVGIAVQNLPGGGVSAGTFVGQLLFQTNGSTVTVPVTVVIGDSVFAQVNPISFTKPFGGADPLPQTLTIASTNARFQFYVSSSTATGGNWLTVSPTCPNTCFTPEAITATVNASPAMPAGTYTGQIVLTSYGSPNFAMTVPVTLTVAPKSATFFDNLPGQMSFSFQTGGNAPPSQPIQIRNGGAGTLNWTLIGTTFNSGQWLSASTLSGTAPSTVNIMVLPQNLPGGGLTAGYFTGQLVFQTNGDIVTVPVSVVVGADVFAQVNPISFVKQFAGANPLPQTLTIASTNAKFQFYVSWSTATGGNWLSASPTCPNTCFTSAAITATVNAGPTLAAGTYTGQIVLTSYGSPDFAMTIPVTLTVAPSAGTFFDNVQGQVSFSLTPGGASPPAQAVQIRNVGPGALSWTLSTSTADGGNWLNASAYSGFTPAIIALGVSVSGLPGQGLVAGIFTGQVVFHAVSGDVTIPVSVVVGANVFSQAAAISFTKPYGGADPLPQIVNVASTGTALQFYVSSSTGRGGSWLSVTPACPNTCLTPQAMTATIKADPSLAGGTYTGQIVFTSYGPPDFAMTVPVILTALPPTAQTITFGALGNVSLGTAPFAISATASSGLPVSFVSNTPNVCTVTGNTVTIVGAGGCSITASQGGNSTYAAAPSVTQKFTVFFADVSSGDYFYNAINLLAQHGITAGCGNNSYCPTQIVTRYQMAIFIVRAIMGGDNFNTSATPYFTDVPNGAPGFNWIQKMYELGITAGCGNGQYCPNTNVSRDQMSVFIIRARYGATAAFSFPGIPTFSDVPASNSYFKWIQRMGLDGITGGCGNQNYCPESAVIRGDMAIFIMRGAFNQLLPPTTPVITQISPSTLPLGTSGTFTITGANTNFAQGTTTLAAIPGVTIGPITVNSPTSLTVQLTAAPNATAQPYSIVAITGSEQAVLPNGLTLQ